MANIMDYLDWRGDLTFSEAPFNEVDNLILSKICCPDLTGVVSGPDRDEDLSLHDAAARYFTRRGDLPDKLGLLISEGILPLIRQASDTRRFRDARLSAYVNRICEQSAEQFSALTIRIGDGTKYIAYRGTDDTITGWKENFNMSFLDAAPAQRDALAYLERAALSGPEPLRVGGHSKGGNLAVYAAMHCPEPVQARVLHVYNNDGPGFRSSVLDRPEYRRIRGRITTLVPQSSIVGMLLEHEEDFAVVKSTAIGPVQHDGLTWEVLGASFRHLEATTGGSRYLDRTLKNWVDALDDEARRSFTDALFDILYATGAKTLTELTDRKLAKTAAMIREYRRLDDTQRAMLHRTMRLLWKAGAESFGGERRKAGRFGES